MTPSCLACQRGITVQEHCATCEDCEGCDSVQLSECQRSAFQASHSRLLGTYVPQCEATGEFTPLQCHSSTGMCWCVNENGAEIELTRTSPGAPLPVCLREEQEICCQSMTAECLACQAGVSVGVICANDPTIDGCASINVTPCQIAALDASRIPRRGAYIPKCEADGSFSKTQCHSSTGMCWCVREDGTEIELTRLTPGNPPKL
jgi:hypothetical protein